MTATATLILTLNRHGENHLLGAFYRHRYAHPSTVGEATRATVGALEANGKAIFPVAAEVG